MQPYEEMLRRAAERTARLRVAINSVHQQDLLAGIKWPDDHGRFPDAPLHPWIFPIVVDANALRDEILRVGQPRTVLANAANQGVLRLYCAAHVIKEVTDHYGQWATDKGVPAAAVCDRWRTTYLPLLRCVEVPSDLTGGEQAERLAFLASSPSRYGDPDDVPSATLAILLAAPLLSRDKGPLRAVYGEGFDHVGHGRWIDKLRAGGDLGPIGGYLQGATAIITGVGTASYYGLNAVVRRAGWQNSIAAGLAGAAAYTVMVRAETKRSIRMALGKLLGALAEALGGMAELRAAALAQFESLSPAAPDWAQVQDELGGDATLTRACMHNLARSPRGMLSAGELSDQLRGQLPGTPCGPAKVRQALRNSPAFAQPTPGRFQLGAALIRRSSDPTAGA
jgi:predicted nucleic acid-binding protein